MKPDTHRYLLSVTRPAGYPSTLVNDVVWGDRLQSKENTINVKGNEKVLERGAAGGKERKVNKF